jgi:putative hydrolase of the HAD superfamily
MGGSVSFPALRQDLTRIARGIKPWPIARGVAPAYDRTMPKQDFAHVETWVFDLDNTLYPPSARLFDQIEARMTQFVMEVLRVSHAEADRLRHAYWRDHGTTLAGLMRLHDLDPGPYLHAVHDISLDHLEPDAGLGAAIRALPGRRIVYTNGAAPYAERVIERRGLAGAFDAVYGVEHADYRPKPEAQAFETVLRRDGSAPARAAMFEDDPRNLSAPHAMGMRTVHVAPERIEAAHIHHHTDDLGGFLARLI